MRLVKEPTDHFVSNEFFKFLLAKGDCRHSGHMNKIKATKIYSPVSCGHVVATEDVRWASASLLCLLPSTFVPSAHDHPSGVS